MSFAQIASMCRGCLSTKQKMVNATVYEAMFKELTGIIISPSDGLPQQLCYECVALLQKCNRFRNKIMKSHYLLCQHVLEGVPFSHDELEAPHLTQTSLMYVDIRTTEMNKVEQQTDTVENNIEINSVTKVNDLEIKEEIPSCEEFCAADPLNELKLTSVSSSHDGNEKNESEQQEVQVEQQTNTVEDNIEISSVTKLQELEVKEEASNSDDEETCVADPSDELSTHDWNEENETEQQEAKRDELHVEVNALRQSVRSSEHLDEHIDAVSALHGEDNEDDVVSDGSDNVRLYVCDECNKRFGNKMLLITHIHKHSNNIIYFSIYKNKKQYICDVCMKSFSSISCFNRHRHVHTGDKLFKCGVCMKYCGSKAFLAQHRRIHTCEKVFTCNVCLNIFTSNRTLDRHRLVHKDRPYKCDVCMKCYTQKSSLIIHRRSHTNDRPYKCDICMKCFTSSSALDRHFRIHTGRKPFKCDFCIKSFTRNSCLDRHRRIHTSEMYKCDDCMSGFTRKYSLIKHIKKQSCHRSK